MLRLTKLNLRLRICSPLFLALCAAVLLTSIAVGMEFENTVYDLNPIPFFAAAAASMISTVFAAGTEFADGTVRSKLVCGITKPRFYLSQLIASLCVSLFFFLLAGVPFFLMGRKRFFSQFDFVLLVRATVLLLAGVVFFTVIAVFITVLVKNRAAVLLVCTGAVMVLAISERETDWRLNRPEYTAVYRSGRETDTDEPRESVIDYVIPNDQYVSEPARTVLYTSLKVNPFQCFVSALDIIRSEGEINRTSLKNIEEEYERIKNSDSKYERNADYFRDRLINCIYYPLWSGGLMLVLTAAGVLIFRKRNIY